MQFLAKHRKRYLDGAWDDVAEPETESEADAHSHEYRLELRRIELLRSGLVLASHLSLETKEP